MKERFEVGGRSHLLDALMRQEFVCGDRAIAERFASVGELQEFPAGAELIKETGEDNDLYLLLAGSVAIVIKGVQVNTRAAGQHVGEMAAIEPSQKRSATVADSSIPERSLSLAIIKTRKFTPTFSSSRVERIVLRSWPLGTGGKPG